jgi:hypothetical protein
MHHELRNKQIRHPRRVIGVLAPIVAGVSHAATLVGGATLPAIGYVGTGAEFNFPAIFPFSNALLGVWKTLA